ncbi:MAG: hypothetical protein QCI82_00490 [Candidatus Thermoplasmatota archaeon]|nr:hypothetical protein [Candidatus Thermoplasmatota archaeon]
MSCQGSGGRPKVAAVTVISAFLMLSLTLLPYFSTGEVPPTRYASQLDLSVLVPYHGAIDKEHTGEACLSMIFDQWGPYVQQQDIRNVTKGPRGSGVAEPLEIVRAGHFSDLSRAASNPLQKGYSARPLGYGAFYYDWTNSKDDPSPRFQERFEDLFEAVTHGYTVMLYMYTDTPPVIDPQPPNPNIPDPNDFPPSGITPPSIDPPVTPSDLARLDKHWRLVVGYESDTTRFKIYDPWPADGFAKGRDEYWIGSNELDRIWNITTPEGTGFDTHRIGVTSGPIKAMLTLPRNDRIEAGTVFEIVANISYAAPPVMAGISIQDPVASLAIPPDYQIMENQTVKPLTITSPRSYTNVVWNVRAPENSYEGQLTGFTLDIRGEVRNVDLGGNSYRDMLGNRIEFNVETFGFFNYPPTITNARIDPAIIPDDGSVQPLITCSVSDVNDNLRQVYVDLTSIGMAPTQKLYDDGTQGDVQAEDGIYSFKILREVSKGMKTLTIYAEDNRGAKSTAEIMLDVRDAKELTDPPVISRMGVSPNSVPNDGFTTSLIWAMIGDTQSDIRKVSADLTPVGGERRFELVDDGTSGDPIEDDGNYSAMFVVSPDTPIGSVDVEITVEDRVGHIVKGRTSFVVVIPPTDPLIIDASAEPRNVPNDGKTRCVLTVYVSDPNEDIESVSVDLSNVGGSQGFQLKDDGIGVDARAGDGIWTGEFFVPSSVSPGNKNIAIKAVDSTDRFSTSTLTIRVEQSNRPPSIIDYRVEPPGGKFKTGEKVTVKVNATDPELQIASVELDLMEMNMGVVELVDDGSGDDEAAGDGTYSGSFIVTGDLNGTYNITIRVIDAAGAEAVVRFPVQVIIEGNGALSIGQGLIVGIPAGIALLLVIVLVASWAIRSRKSSKAPQLQSPQGGFRPVDRPQPRFTPVAGAGPR